MIQWRFSFYLLSAVFACLISPAPHFAWNGYHTASRSDTFNMLSVVQTPTDGGIREEVPQKFRARFETWKAELLSTEFGRQQWGTYANNKNFVLTIKVSGNRGSDAGTDRFQWDETGNFVGATITIGSRIDSGYPPPIYYPVLNSLASDAAVHSINGSILAATKLSHELGHVEQTAEANVKFLQLQNKLVPAYILIFLKNGLNTRDKKLIELADQMGGTPTEIWESREYWSEVTAMQFLHDRLSNEEIYCRVFEKIKRNVREYAKGYEDRFHKFPELISARCAK
ncbi:MAG: hypothetical protein WBO68_07585 [Pyrinomonadaceae bacterium]